MKDGIPETYPDTPNRWTEDLIRELCDENHGENRFIEYKRSFEEIDKTNLEREMTAFANARGGFIIFGVNDDKTPKGIENPDVETVRQRVKEIAAQTTPAVDVELSDAISAGDSGYAFLVLLVEEHRDKPVATSDGAYYRRMTESKQPLARDTLMTEFVNKEQKQQDERRLAFEIDRVNRVYNELDDQSDERPPAFGIVDTDAIRSAVRKPNHLFTDEDIREDLQDVLKYLWEIDRWEGRYYGEIPHEGVYQRSEEGKNLLFSRELKRKVDKVLERLNRIDPRKD